MLKVPSIGRDLPERTGRALGALSRKSFVLAGFSAPSGSPLAFLSYHLLMAVCRECENEVDSLKTVKVGSKKKKMCEDCADRIAQDEAVAEESEAVVQQMMGFKGKR